MKENNSKIDIKTKENKQPDIKIFVSHRIDMEAETIDNPLYVNVRCGAVYDKRENIDMLGDDTGDNISEKRNMYNELTVQYWAWKNVEADYYGLCHYRRHFSFAEKKSSERTNEQVLLYKEEYLNKHTVEKYGINDANLIYNLVSEYDCIVQEGSDVRKLQIMPGHIIRNLFDYWKYIDDVIGYIKYEIIEQVLEYIKEKYPEIYPYAMQYLNGYYYVGFNCFIMKKNIFNEYCSYLFDTLNYVEEILNNSNEYESYSKKRMQTYALIGEISTGIYAYFLEQKNIKVKHLPLIFFKNSEKQKELIPFSKENNIPIVVRISDYYAPYFAVLLQSIIDNADSKNNYDIIVLEHTVTKENKDIISKMIQDKHNISVRYFNPEYVLNNISLHVAAHVYTREAYYTIFSPWFLQNYNKLLVIDSDLILQGDIAEIYNQDISNYFAGACKDIVYMGMLNMNIDNFVEYTNDILKLKNSYNYINTGVILLNTENIRKEFELDYIIVKSEKNKYRIQEQDLLNVLFDGKIKFLDIKYNYLINVNHWVTSMMLESPKTYNDIYIKTQKYPFVIHYANQPKPWINPYVPFAHKWWEIARQTPFYEIILIRMTHEQSNHISFDTIDHFSRIMFPFKWLKKVHKVSYIRQIADKLLPHGTKRRKIVKKLLFG